MDTLSTTSDRPRITPVSTTAFEEAQTQLSARLRAAVPDKLDVRMTAACAAVCGMFEQHYVSLRDAAYLIAVDRTAQACRERGWG